MLAFAICLVFGAHPDCWLSESEFDAKWKIDRIKQGIDDCYRSIEIIAAKAREDPTPERYDPLIRNALLTIEESRKYLAKKRVGCRTLAIAHPKLYEHSKPRRR